MATTYEFGAFFKKAGVGTAPSSAPTIKVVDSADNILVAALTATVALANLVGAYRYSYTGADGLILYGVFTTTDLTMDESQLGGVAIIKAADVAAIKAITDQFVFTVANQVDANALTGGLTGAQIRTAIGMTAADLDSQLAGIPTDILDEVAGVEAGHTVRQSLRLMLAALAGKLSGADTTSIRIRDTNDTKDRIVASVDSHGNRWKITEDAT